MSMIYTEDASIKIGGVILPGIYKSVEVSADALIEEQEVEGSAVKPKQAMGYEDAKISIDIELWDSATLTKEDKLRIVQDIFRRPGQDKPEAKEIISSQTDLRGVNKVILKNMTSKISNKKDNISVMLELWEYIPMTIKAAAGSKGGSGGQEAVPADQITAGLIAGGLTMGTILADPKTPHKLDWAAIGKKRQAAKAQEFTAHVRHLENFGRTNNKMEGKA